MIRPSPRGEGTAKPGVRGSFLGAKSANPSPTASRSPLSRRPTARRALGRKAGGRGEGGEGRCLNPRLAPWATICRSFDVIDGAEFLNELLTQDTSRSVRDAPKFIRRVDLNLGHGFVLRFIEGRKAGRFGRAQLAEMLLRRFETPMIGVRRAVAPSEPVGLGGGVEGGLVIPG